MTRSSAAAWIVAAVLFLVAVNPGLTGVSVHEWVGLAAFVALIAHCAQQFDRFSGMVRGAVRGPSLRLAARCALMVLTALSLAACVLSGLLVSGAVLPALGMYAGGYHLWAPVHAASAKLLLALVVVHVVLHLRRIGALLSRKGENRHDGHDG